MAQIYCPGGQCGVRNHIVGSESHIQCQALTKMRQAVSGIGRTSSMTSAPKLSTGAKRTSWQDQGYEGEITLCPAGCNCPGCGAGQSTPITSLSSEQIMGLIGGTHAMNNRSSGSVVFDVQSEGGSLMVRYGSKTWELDADEIDEGDIIREFDREGNPVES